ncbi:MAG TPA: hypothetical protein VL282_11645, partial [Tepidisphaeraceae bacterium]|nr:hypothetical protein [Tepidisphaeraceae bacterium]
MDVRVFGYCALSPEAIVRTPIDQLRGVDGNYVIALTMPTETTLVSAAEGVWPHYYAVADGRFYHGPTVADVLRQSRLPWEWNWRALADVALNEHTIEDETLHPDVHRVPADAVVKFQDGRLAIDRRSWDEIHPPGQATAGEAVDVLNDEVSRWADSSSIVAMSAGFDSRLLLSSLLHKGDRPRLLSMGFEESTDVVIASRIARELDLPFTRIELAADDYIQHARRVAELTGGTKPAVHWHTFIAAHKAEIDPATRLFVGSNGEFCRSFLLDNGIASRIAGAVPGEMLLRKFWTLKFKPPFDENDLRAMPDEFAKRLRAEGRAEWADRRVALCTGGFLPGLDKFYLTQRVRHFIGNGLILYSASCKPITPMTSLRWTSLIWNLGRRWKHGSAWHRFAIHRNNPGLMDFPEEGTSGRMPLRPRPLYWLHGKPKSVPYHKYDEWFRRGAMIDFIRGNAAILSDVIEPAQVQRICDQQEATNARQRAIAFFMSLIAWKQVIA